jgi:hypothetical protein
MIKAARLQIHSEFHEIFKIYLKVKYRVVNKENNSKIAKSNCNPSKLQKKIISKYAC